MPKRPDERVDYEVHQHAAYDSGRHLRPEARQLWADVAGRHLSACGARTVLDLGSGTGRFAELLAAELGVSVIGVEPSDRMRARADSCRAHPAVIYRRGEAARIPLASASVDAVWMSMVVHHIPDLAEAATEIHRVLAPGGRVLIRSSFSGRLETFRIYACFPGARAADEARLPSVEAVRGAFEAQGFAFQRLEVVTQLLDLTWVDHIERMRQRALSSFESISDEEFAAGLRGEPEPVMEDIDVLVLERAPSRQHRP